MEFNAVSREVLNDETITLLEAGYLNEDFTLSKELRNELWAIILADNKDAILEKAKAKIEARKNLKK